MGLIVLVIGYVVMINCLGEVSMVYMYVLFC